MRGTKKAGFFAVLSVVLLASCSGRHVEMTEGGRAKGKILMVDKSGDAGQYVAMDLAGANRVHLVYVDNKKKELRYARQSDEGFAFDTVDADCLECLFAAIRVGADEQPNVVYYSDASKSMVYAYKKEGIWKRERIDWGEKTGMGARLLFDADSNPHVLYYSGDGYLKHAWRALRKDDGKPAAKSGAEEKAPAAKKDELDATEAEGIWGNEQVDKSNGSEKVLISFVHQPKGGFAASYLNWSGLTSELRMTVQGQDGKWTSEIIAREDNPGKSSGMLFGPTGDPLIVFREARKDRLSLASYSAKGWTLNPLLDDAYNMALAGDKSGTLLVAYEKFSGADPRKGHLCMAVKKGGAWTHYQVDSAIGAGTHLDVALTSNGIPLIAYYEESGRSLKLFVGE